MPLLKRPPRMKACVTVVEGRGFRSALVFQPPRHRHFGKGDAVELSPFCRLVGELLAVRRGQNEAAAVNIQSRCGRRKINSAGECVGASVSQAPRLIVNR